MIQPWIFGGSLLAGGGLVAFVLNTQAPDRSRLPSLEPSPQAVNVLPPEPPPVVVEPVSRVLELPEVVIAGRAARVVEIVPAPAPASLTPCSPWRELGPTHVVSSSVNDTVSVRTLCQ